MCKPQTCASSHAEQRAFALSESPRAVGVGAAPPEGGVGTELTFDRGAAMALPGTAVASELLALPSGRGDLPRLPSYKRWRPRRFIMMPAVGMPLRSRVTCEHIRPLMGCQRLGVELRARILNPFVAIECAGKHSLVAVDVATKRVCDVDPLH
jgi:hypothetical protein